MDIDADTVSTFRSNINPVIRFVDEECIIGDQCYVSQIYLYQAYVGWTKQHGMKPLGRFSFTKQLQKNVAVLRRFPLHYPRKSILQGIRLSSAWERLMSSQ